MFYIQYVKTGSAILAPVEDVALLQNDHRKWNEDDCHQEDEEPK